MAKVIENSFYYRQCIVVKNSHSILNSYLINILRQNKFDCQIVTKDDKDLILISQTDEKKLLIEAQLRKIRRATSNPLPLNSNLPEKLLIEENKRPYTTLSPDLFKSDKVYEDFYDMIGKKSNERWGLGLFTEAEMLYLEKSILTEIVIDPKEFLQVYQQETDKNIHLKETEGADKESLEAFLKAEQRIFFVYEHLHLFEDTFPVHTSIFKEVVGTENLIDIKKSTGFNVHNFRNYLGDYMAIYFYWLDHYTSKNLNLINFRMASFTCSIFVGVFYTKILFFTRVQLSHHYLRAVFNYMGSVLFCKLEKEMLRTYHSMG